MSQEEHSPLHQSEGCLKSEGQRVHFATSEDDVTQSEACRMGQHRSPLSLSPGQLGSESHDCH